MFQIVFLCLKYNKELLIDNYYIKKNEMLYFFGFNIINILKEINFLLSYVCEDLGIK